jgi:hypothetical protein
MILVPHDHNDFSKPIGLTQLKRTDPLTFGFFKQFEKELKARSGYKQLHKQRDEFYVVGNVGNYTLAPYKVVFKDLTEVFQCAVVSSLPTADGSNIKPVVPDHTVLFIASDEKDEAYFLAGILNSIPARAALYGASIGVQTQRYYPTDVSRIRIPAFDPNNENHQQIVLISEKCHQDFTEEQSPKQPTKEEMELAAAVATMFGVSSKDLKRIIEYYGEIVSFRGRSSDDVEDEID